MARQTRWIAGIAVVLVVFVAVAIRMGSSDRDATAGEWSTRELAEKLASGAAFRLIDVREPDEYRASHIPGAELIPLGQLPHRLAELDPDDEIGVICRSGNRSRQAVAILKQAGFSRVYNVAGGMLAWQGPVITGP